MTGKEFSTGGNKGRRVQMRTTRVDGWSERARRVFLDHLAATCNVRRSAEAAERSERSAYALRRRDGEFAALWQAAIEIGYDRIEALALERVLAARSVTLPEREDGDPLPPDPADLDFAKAMEILRYHQAGRRGGKHPGGAKMQSATKAELIAALTDRLNRLDALERKYPGAYDRG